MVGAFCAYGLSMEECYVCVWWDLCSVVWGLVNRSVTGLRTSYLCQVESSPEPFSATMHCVLDLAVIEFPLRNEAEWRKQFAIVL